MVASFERIVLIEGVSRSVQFTWHETKFTFC